MKGNTDKCHSIMITNNAKEIQVVESLIKTSNYEKLLDIKIDYKLTFDNHINTSCKKANNKLRVLARATSYMTIEKKKPLMNSFSMHNLIIVPFYECCIFVTVLIKSNIYARDV